MLLFYFIIFSYVVEGKLNLGGSWNRPYHVGYNGTVIDYIKDLAEKMGQFGIENGLQIRAVDYSFPISQELLGVKLKGTVEFNDGIVINSGKIVPSVYAPESNRSSDLSKAFISFAVRLNQLDVTYKLKTKLEENNTDGSVELNLKNVDFFFVVDIFSHASLRKGMTHNFATNTNDIKPELISFWEEVEWTIKPRTVVTYAIETVAKRSNSTAEWYRESLIAWQRQYLGPMLVQQAQDLPFPISPN